jgi:hypothetical protein
MSLAPSTKTSLLEKLYNQEVHMTNEKNQSQEPFVSQEAQELEEIQLETVVGGGSLRNFFKCCIGGSPTTEDPLASVPQPLHMSHPITTIAEGPESPSSSVPAPHGPIDPRQSKGGHIRTESGSVVSRADYMAFMADPSRSLKKHK